MLPLIAFSLSSKKALAELLGGDLTKKSPHRALPTSTSTRSALMPNHHQRAGLKGSGRPARRTALLAHLVSCLGMAVSHSSLFPKLQRLLVSINESMQHFTPTLEWMSRDSTHGKVFVCRRRVWTGLLHVQQPTFTLHFIRLNLLVSQKERRLSPQRTLNLWARWYISRTLQCFRLLG